MNAGITIEITDPEVDVKWGQILFKLGEAACHGLGVFVGKLDSAAGALNAIHAMFEGMSINDTPETKAWRLVVTSIASAVSDLSATSLNDKQQQAVLKAFKTFRQKSDDVLKGGDHVLTPEFMSYPANLELYQALRKDLITALKSVRLDKKIDAEHLGGKLDKAFNSSVYRILKAKPEYFQSLSAALETRGLDIAQHELDWARYRSHLMDQFEVAPVFGQEENKISLSQLYISPRAQWREKVVDEGSIVFHTVNLEDDIMQWINDSAPHHAIKLIYGGPGRGKSTFTKALAAKLAQNEGLRPLFIELQKLSFDGKLLDEISDLLIHTVEAFKTAPLDHKDANRPFVLIFDGLDELARPGGRGADDLAREFSHSLDMLLNDLNGQNEVRALAIVTGRDAIIQSLKTRSRGLDDCHALEVCGYAPIDDEVGGPTGLKAQDQRPDWWRRYAIATGKLTKVPKAFVAEELEELSNEPLLCYLLALADIAAQDWKEVAHNRNIIYQTLLHDVWERKWGDGIQGPTKSITTEQNFDLLMETMALAAWHGDGAENRIATMEGFTAACTVTRATTVWNTFDADQARNPEKSLSSLALTFYFRRPNSDSQGVEFSHKSFSEYLVARLLFRSALELAEDFEHPRSNLDALLKDWLMLAGRTCIDEYIFSFIRNEARTLNIKTLLNARNTLEKMFNIVIRDGMPAHEATPATWRRAEQMQRNGETALLACLNAIIRELFERAPDTDILKFDWGENSSAPARFIRRFVDNEGAPEFPHLGLSHANFSHENGSFMTGLFLADARLDHCDFQRAVLAHAYLSGASLPNASFIGAALSEADLTGADLTGANLKGADLRGADLTDANLARASLTGASLTGANLTGANISGADLPKNWIALVHFDDEDPPVGEPNEEK